jgi:D-glycero-alpha-D-manno-heptose-7-phosphate kinase
MREEWAFRKRNLPTISTPTIDRIIRSARNAGGLAGKVCGAGGGGCVTLLIEPSSRRRVEVAVEAAGGQLLPIRIDLTGARVRLQP